MSSFNEEFDRIIADTDQLLWASYLASAGASPPTPSAQLRFPCNRNGDVRVSEQEARFALTSQLARSQLLYSVETPTSLTYQLTGASALSGQTDVTVYSPRGEGMWNIEFKEGGFTEERANKLSVQKDIEKLIREPLPAYWFHTLEGVDNSSLSVIWRAFLADIRDVTQRLVLDKLVAKTFVFHACIVRQHFSVERKLLFDPHSLHGGNTHEIPGPTYSVSRASLTSFEAKDGWEYRCDEVNQ